MNRVSGRDSVPGIVNAPVFEWTAPDQSIQRVRARLMAGYGPGATEATVMAVTRDRLFFASWPTAAWLERVAQQTLRERADTTSVLGRFTRVARHSVLFVGAGALIVFRAVQLTRRRARLR